MRPDNALTNTEDIEVWREIPGYESYYEVSNLGKVRSLDRLVIYVNGRINKLRGRILKFQTDLRSSYLTAILYKNKKDNGVYVHYLVALAFIGPRPTGYEVAHWDGNRTNNNASNLRYATKRDNQLDRIRHGTCQSGEENVNCKLSEKDALEIIENIESLTQRQLGVKYGISQARVSKIKRGEGWRYLTEVNNESVK